MTSRPFEGQGRRRRVVELDELVRCRCAAGDDLADHQVVRHRQAHAARNLEHRHRRECGREHRDHDQDRQGPMAAETGGRSAGDGHGTPLEPEACGPSKDAGIGVIGRLAVAYRPLTVQSAADVHPTTRLRRLARRSPTPGSPGGAWRAARGRGGSRRGAGRRAARRHPEPSLPARAGAPEQAARPRGLRRVGAASTDPGPRLPPAAEPVGVAGHRVRGGRRLLRLDRVPPGRDRIRGRDRPAAGRDVPDVRRADRRRLVRLAAPRAVRHGRGDRQLHPRRHHDRRDVSDDRRHARCVRRARGRSRRA